MTVEPILQTLESLGFLVPAKDWEGNSWYRLEKELWGQSPHPREPLTYHEQRPGLLSAKPGNATDSSEGRREKGTVPSTQSTEPKPKASTPSLSPEALVQAFGEVLPKLKQPRLPLGSSLKKTLASAIRREGWSEAEWREYFTTILSIPFLLGKEADWEASLPWLIGPKNMAKVQGGAYLKNGKKLEDVDVVYSGVRLMRDLPPEMDQ